VGVFRRKYVHRKLHALEFNEIGNAPRMSERLSRSHGVSVFGDIFLRREEKM
jgi:hypothetical protein